MIDIEEMVREIRRKEKEGKQLSLEDFTPQSKKNINYATRKSNIFKKNKRLDGRDLSEHRKMFIQLGSVSDARGSCYIEQGDTKVILSVRGPKEIPNIQEYTELCVIECLIDYAPFVKNPTSDEGFMSEAMRLALEPVLCRHEFPNLQITLSAFILEDGGSTLSTVITGACLALSHARLPIFGLLSSVTLGIHNNLMLVDPTKEEEDFCITPFDSEKVSQHGLVTIAFMKELDQITLYQMNGNIKSNVLASILHTLTNHCSDVTTLCYQHLMKELKESVKSIAEAKLTAEAVSNLSITN